MLLPTRSNVAFLQHAEELGLETGGDLADLVEQQRAAVGQLESPAAEAIGAGERAFLVAEQFAFQQMLAEGGAVDGQHRPIAAGGGGMDGAGDDFLARAAFAADHDGGAAASHQLDLAFHLGHDRAGSHERARSGGLGHAAQGLVFLEQSAVLQGAVDEQLDLVPVEGLLNVVVSSELHRLDGGGDAGESGHHHHRRIGADALGLSKQLDAGHLRHLQIADEQVESARAAEARPPPRGPSLAATIS